MIDWRSSDGSHKLHTPSPSVTSPFEGIVTMMSSRNPIVSDALSSVRFVIAFVRVRLEPLRERSDRGASAIEWAIIAAISIAAAVLVGGIVISKINSTKSCIQGSGSTTGCSGGK